MVNSPYRARSTISTTRHRLSFDKGRVLLVVRFQLVRALHHLAVLRMRDASIDPHDHSLVHLVTHDQASTHLARCPFGDAILRGVRVVHLSHRSGFRLAAAGL
jgi:hypothetical protein